MAGGLMQLVAYGSQDIYLSGNPQITFFKAIYRRHTNFAIETIEHTFTGIPNFNRRVSAKILRSGDLASKVYIRVVLGSVDPGNLNFAWVRRVGHAIIREVEVEIGGTKMDRQYGTWLDIWYELARRGDHEVGYAKMIGDVPELTTYDSSIKPEYILYIPLQFWFNRHIGLSLPLIAMQYHDVYIHVEFESINKLIIWNPDCKTDGCATDSENNFTPSSINMVDATILVNYVYLDSDERRRFALVGHEYLIEQIQYNGLERVVRNETRYTLDFNHPVKELLWCMRSGNYFNGERFVYYTGSDTWSVNDAACEIIKKSISITTNPTSIVGGEWTEVESGRILQVGNLNVKNQNANSVFVNSESLTIGTYGITDKIKSDVVVDSDGLITCGNLRTTLTIRDISIPVRFMTDTRFQTRDPRVNIFSNYGILIDGTVNPVQNALLQLNGQDRFDRREGAFFNYVQPEQHHENTPADGINVYSFALYPEQHQPSGTSNFSRVEQSDLIIRFTDSTSAMDLPDLNFFNEDNELYIFGVNYNILRVLAGFAGLSYTA